MTKRIDTSSLPYGKSKRVRDTKHLKFVASLQCVKCARIPTQACHIRTGQTGGTGLKPSDDLVFPGCPECHHLQHSKFGEEFWGDTDRLKRLARKLYEISGDREAGVFLVMAFLRNREE